MGGYGAFVWPSYGLAALVLAGLVFATLRELRAREKRLAILEEARPKRRPRKTGQNATGEEGGP